MHTNGERLQQKNLRTIGQIDGRTLTFSYHRFIFYMLAFCCAQKAANKGEKIGVINAKKCFG